MLEAPKGLFEERELHEQQSQQDVDWPELSFHDVLNATKVFGHVLLFDNLF